jgi:TPR repeat protein
MVELAVCSGNGWHLFSVEAIGTAMKIPQFSICMLLVLLFSACGTTNINRRAADQELLEEGTDAYERGDYAEAWWQLAPLAERGDALAQTKLGNMYYLGLGVPEDDREAAKWFGRAADQGDAEAQIMLGTLYVLGTGVPQDYAAAVRLFRMPAELGIGGAQFLLGMLYMNGNGVPQDPELAYTWMELAVRRGSKAAREARLILSERLTPEQVARATAMADAWKPGQTIKRK